MLNLSNIASNFAIVAMFVITGVRTISSIVLMCVSIIYLHTHQISHA